MPNLTANQMSAFLAFHNEAELTASNLTTLIAVRYVVSVNDEYTSYNNVAEAEEFAMQAKDTDDRASIQILDLFEVVRNDENVAIRFETIY